jgi:hypothetical protein
MGKKRGAQEKGCDPAQIRLSLADTLAKYRPAKAGLCGCGGIGRRAALRSLWGNTREGSSPFIRTNPAWAYFRRVTLKIWRKSPSFEIFGKI